MKYLAIIILANLVYYYRTLSFSYVSDDIVVTEDTPAIVNKKDIFWCHFFGTNYKNHRLAHKMRLAIHIINACLVYLVFGSNLVSFTAALLFSFNPIMLQGGIWLSGGGYARTTLSVLSMFYLAQHFAPISQIGAFQLVMVGYFIAMFSGLTGLFAPILLTFFINPIYLFLLVPGLVTTFKYHFNQKYLETKKDGMTPEMAEKSWRKLIIGVKTFGYYTQLCIFPRRLGMYHEFGYNFGLRPEDNKEWFNWKTKKFAWGIFCLLVCLAGLIYQPTRLGTFWYMLFIAQWSNFSVMPQQPIAERYCYLANVGLMYCLAVLLPPLGSLLLLEYYIIRNVFALGAYKNDQLWLDYNTYDINFPKQYFVWTLKGSNADQKEHRPFKALEMLAEGLKHRPNDERINFYLANLLLSLGFVEPADHHLKIAEANPITTPSKNSLANGCKVLREMLDKVKADKARVEAEKKPQEVPAVQPVAEVVV